MILLYWIFCEVKSLQDKNGIEETNKKLLQVRDNDSLGEGDTIEG